MFGTFAYVWFIIGVIEDAMIYFDCDDIPTEAEARSQFRRRRSVVTRRLVPLSGRAPVPHASTSRERSRELLEETFDNLMLYFKRGHFCGIP